MRRAGPSSRIKKRKVIKMKKMMMNKRIDIK